MADQLFTGLLAIDLMQRDIVTIRPQDTLRDALTLMTENHVTGLPVMDKRSKCVGLITATDILNYERDHDDDSGGDASVQFFDNESQQWQSYPVTSFALDEIADVRVEEVMARDLIYVERNASSQTAAKKMLDAGVHRVLVMDEECRLYGIISATDFVRIVAQ